MKLPARRPRRLGPPAKDGRNGALAAAGEGFAENAAPAEDESVNQEATQTAEPPAEEEDTDSAEAVMQMSLREHLIELRGRLMRCVFAVLAGFIGIFYFAPMLRDILVAPLKNLMPPTWEISITSLTEPFLVDMRMALVLGIFAASPYIFYQIWAFIAPGLYASERKYVVPVALCSALFFIGGGAFCYFVVFPFGFEFFVDYAKKTNSIITLANHYDFSLRLLLAFGAIFEMPLFCFFLARLGVVTAKKMRAWRKYAILSNFIIAAIITPPDVYSQLLMAIPLLLLYEFSILVAAVFGRRDDAVKPEAQAEPGNAASEKQTSDA